MKLRLARGIVIVLVIVVVAVVALRQVEDSVRLHLAQSPWRSDSVIER